MHWLIALTLLVFASLAHAESPPVGINQLKVGFFMQSFPYLSRLDAEVGLKYWGEQLGKSENIDVTITLYEDIEKMRTDFNDGRTNIIVTAPLVILKHFNRDLLAEGITVSRQGSTTQNLVVITRKNERMDDFKALYAKKVGILEHDDLSEAYLDFLSLTHFAKTYTNAGIKPIWQNKKSHLVMDLFFKKLDAIILFERYYLVQIDLNPQIREQTQVIARLPNISSGLGLFHKDVPESLRKKVISIWLGLGTTPGDKFLLQIFQADKFENASIKDLQSIENFLAEYQTQQQQHSNNPPSAAKKRH